MSELKPGDEILVTAPFGRFTRHTAGGVMVAAGTGIAPFVSMIRSGKASGALLIHGASYVSGFFYADELRKELGDRYIACCSRCLEVNGFMGRVTRFLEQWSGIDAAKKHYLCGSAEMVVDTRDVLIARGVPFGQIEAEIFF
jgi:ferredoxin--NADP+ reductase